MKVLILEPWFVVNASVFGFELQSADSLKTVPLDKMLMIELVLQLEYFDFSCKVTLEHTWIAFFLVINPLTHGRLNAMTGMNLTLHVLAFAAFASGWWFKKVISIWPDFLEKSNF